MGADGPGDLRRSYIFKSLFFVPSVKNEALVQNPRIVKVGKDLQDRLIQPHISSLATVTGLGRQAGFLQHFWKRRGHGQGTGQGTS